MRTDIVKPHSSSCGICPHANDCSQLKRKESRKNEYCQQGYVDRFTDPCRTMARVIPGTDGRYTLWLSYRTDRTWRSINHANGIPYSFGTVAAATEYLRSLLPSR